MSPQVARRNVTPHSQNVKTQQQEETVKVEKKEEVCLNVVFYLFTKTKELNTSVNESIEEHVEEEEEDEVTEEYMKELSIDPSIEMFLKQILPSGLEQTDSGTIGGTSFVGELNLDNLTLDSDLEDYVNGLLQNATFS